MDMNTLMALSPLDGRYQKKLSALREIFSEYGLIRFRVIVEISWLKVLSESQQIPEISASSQSEKILNSIVEQFSEKDALAIKKIEEKTNHDVKAVEYFIKEKLEKETALKPFVPFIHFACTSEDINNLAYALMLASVRDKCLLPNLKELESAIRTLAHNFADLPMLARTHGQAASPTTLGKEFANVLARLDRQHEQLAHASILGKLNGATGNYSAFAVAYPDINWPHFNEKFVKSLGLEWNSYTTQIEPHDFLAEFFAILNRINTILIDFNRDVWSYISINYFTQKSKEHEVGSSTMPHKINPIDFENAEGNFGIANALLDHMMHKLPISRWQRDLSDSTVLRNIGVALGHVLLGYQSTLTGLKKLIPNEKLIVEDLNAHWEVLAEAIQTIMRKHKHDAAYEQLKSFTRGKQITKALIQQFIQDLPLDAAEKNKLLELTPENYLGYAKELAKNI